MNPPVIELTLPAVDIPASETSTVHGALRIPGRRLPAKTVQIDPAQLNALAQAARAAARAAYAPYSRFRVGAALIMADDPERHIFTGVNVENSSYGVTCCAERGGLFAAAAANFRRLQWLAVSTLDALDRPLAERSPCGVCRQTIKEFGDGDVDTAGALILIDSGDDDVLGDVFDVERLLPYGFNFSGSTS